MINQSKKNSKVQAATHMPAWCVSKGQALRVLLKKFYPELVEGHYTVIYILI